ncbi:acyl-CoA dehydrogenase family protein [Futiania mangrovi]|uniref:Acyl-CoA dehydrogenase family protein n=1 Tax=Futiania mangrovi TaxID=2959716 RepID=A0A9J6PEB1_9PROT|nr:acyl-CoA dehydrogenase family protein [Futiania mangrovii]MCP1337017.1 acyl-CoA dehydrogenase family protein [Futiania mangrovii]
MTVTRRPGANTIEEPVFRDMCRRFAEVEAAPRWEKADREKAYPRDFYEAAARAGLIGITASEDIGGANLGATEEAICLEEVSKVNPNLAVSLLVQNVAGSILYDFGAPQHRELARRNIAGDCMVAIAVTEPEAGNDIQNVSTRATRDGDHWMLSGMKAFITLGGDADVLVLLAQTDPSKGRHGMQFFAVDRASEGVIASQIDTYVNRPAPTYRITLNDVRVPEERRLDAGFREIMAGFNRERIMVSARWLGHMQHALDWAVEYAQTRQQFGRPIGANQSIAFQLAQAKVDVEAARHLTYHAARKWDSGVPVGDVILDVSTAKLFVTQAVVRVTQTALHVAGGWGLTSELPAMRMAMDALVAPVTVGSYEIQLRAIARQMGLPCD